MDWEDAALLIEQKFHVDPSTLTLDQFMRRLSMVRQTVRKPAPPPLTSPAGSIARTREQLEARMDRIGDDLKAFVSNARS